MKKFEPKRSAKSILDHPTKEPIWEYLNSKETKIRMKTATYLKRPALEALQEQLLEKFGDVLKDGPDKDLWKRMVGSMVAQILDDEGYEVDQTGVRTRVGDVFTSAARYKVKEKKSKN